MRCFFCLINKSLIRKRLIFRHLYPSSLIKCLETYLKIIFQKVLNRPFVRVYVVIQHDDLRSVCVWWGDYQYHNQIIQHDDLRSVCVWWGDYQYHNQIIQHDDLRSVCVWWGVISIIIK